jgi:hypothetical protein
VCGFGSLRRSRRIRPCRNRPEFKDARAPNHRSTTTERRNSTAIRAFRIGRGMEYPGILFPYRSPAAGAKRGASPYSTSRDPARRHYNRIRPHASLGYKPPAPEVYVPALAAWQAALRRTAAPATLAPKPTFKLTFQLDHSVGADQIRNKCSSGGTFLARTV